MTKLQLITNLKYQLSFSIILGMMMLIPMKSIGNNKTQPITNNLHSSGVVLSTQETNKKLTVSFPGSADIDTVKNNPEMDTHYPGGKTAWNLFFRKNFKYPEEALTTGINRIVSVKFIISKKGSIKKAEMITGIDKTYDKAILKVVNMMPDWTPFLKDGVPVEVPFELNILLNLDGPFKDDVILDKQIEKQPEYPGGDDAMMKFLRDIIQYPTTAQQSGTQGTVYIRFVVRYTGKVTDRKVVNRIGNGLDEEALRVVKEMPDWIPGRDNGKAVSVYHTIPIKFKLNSDRGGTPMW
jgi:TonB family protein